jgi:hypothetical protein
MMNGTDGTFLCLEQRHVEALDNAERLIFCCNYCPYFDLKVLFADRSPPARERFRALFSDFYNLNTSHPTDEFKTRFFEIMFDGRVIVEGCPNWHEILTELSRIKRKKGDYAMPFSFVSKLVGMHLESSPIYDKHVLAFFGETPISASIRAGKRIEWFVGFLSQIANSYDAWAADVRVKPILDRFKARDARLRGCHDVRLLDFLVWKVGNGKLLPKLRAAR